MSDKSAENLRRIRAWDAEWDESKHSRADNGQFTSGGGGGAKVSKLQSGGKAKVQQLKNVSGALAGVNAGIEKADNTFAARMDRTRKAGAAKHKDLEQREDAVRKKYEGDWRYGHMYGKLKNKPGMERLAERVKNKAKSREAQKRDELAGLEKEYHQIQNEYDPIVGERQRAANKQYEKSMRQLYPQKQALEEQQKKFQGAKKTLEKAKPGIAKMREQAKAAAPAAAPSTSPEQSAAKFTKIAETFKKIDPQVAKYAKQAAKIAAKSGEAAALEWAKNKSAEIEADPELWPIAKGFHQGRLRMLTEQYNRPAETPAQNRAPAPAPAPQPSKKSDVGQKGIDYLRSISHVNSSFEENTGYTARNMLDMINEGKTLKEIRNEMRANIKKHSPDIDGDLQHLDSIIARVKRAQQ